MFLVAASSYLGIVFMLASEREERDFIRLIYTIVGAICFAVAIGAVMIYIWEP